jgi:hypothetical protein
MQYKEFTFKDGETISAGTDRLKGLIQQLTILGQPTTTKESKCERLKSALANSRFGHLASYLAMEAWKH